VAVVTLCILKRFNPRVFVNHLKADKSGAREYGNLLTTILPYHSFGKYYYVLICKDNVIRNVINELVLSVYTKHHLKNPWWIPVTLISNVLALVLASVSAIYGQKLVHK